MMILFTNGPTRRAALDRFRKVLAGQLPMECIQASRPMAAIASDTLLHNPLTGADVLYSGKQVSASLKSGSDPVMLKMYECACGAHTVASESVSNCPTCAADLGTPEDLEYEAQDETETVEPLEPTNNQESTMKPIIATASNRDKAVKLFAKKVLASSAANKVLASSGSKKLVAEDVLFGTCSKCNFVTFSSASFDSLPNGSIDCGNCKAKITASDLGIVGEMSIDANKDEGVVVEENTPSTEEEWETVSEGDSLEDGEDIEVEEFDDDSELEDESVEETEELDDTDGIEESSDEELMLDDETDDTEESEDSELEDDGEEVEIDDDLEVESSDEEEEEEGEEIIEANAKADYWKGSEISEQSCYVIAGILNTKFGTKFTQYDVAATFNGDAPFTSSAKKEACYNAQKKLVDGIRPGLWDELDEIARLGATLEPLFGIGLPHPKAGFGLTSNKAVLAVHKKHKPMAAKLIAKYKAWKAGETEASDAIVNDPDVEWASYDGDDADLSIEESEGDAEDLGEEVADAINMTDGDTDEEIDLLEVSEVEPEDQVEVSFVSAANKPSHWQAAVAGVVVATIRKDQVKGTLAALADDFGKQRFGIAAATALESGRANFATTAKSLGFRPVTIKSPIHNHVARLVANATAGVKADYAAKQKALASELKQALVVAATGLNRGFYAAVSHPVRKLVYQALSSAQVRGATRIANAAFKEGGEAYAKVLISLAFEHMAKPEVARREIASSILGMGYQALAGEGETGEDQAVDESVELDADVEATEGAEDTADMDFVQRIEDGFDTASDRRSTVASTQGSFVERARAAFKYMR